MIDHTEPRRQILGDSTVRAVGDRSREASTSQALLRAAPRQHRDTSRYETTSSRASSVDGRSGRIYHQSSRPRSSNVRYNGDHHGREKSYVTSGSSRYDRDQYDNRRLSRHDRSTDSRALVGLQSSDNRRDRYRDSGRSTHEIGRSDRNDMYGSQYNYGRRPAKSSGRDRYSRRDSARAESRYGADSRYSSRNDSQDSEGRDRNDLARAAGRIAARDARRYASRLTRH